MGGNARRGAVKLSTQFTQTALSARVEQLHCQMKEQEGGSRGLTERWGWVVCRKGVKEVDRGSKDE